MALTPLGQRERPRHAPALLVSSVMGCGLMGALPAAAFPPYRSTDADTAGAGMLELRLGVLKVQRTGTTKERSGPLTRTNLGIGEHFEVTSELEYSRDQGHLGDGALGFKWARLESGLGVGLETLLLLPVQSDQSGAGIESQFLTTVQRELWEVHVNAGGFYDPRSSDTQRGWRASVLAEFPRERLQPGIEVFARNVRSEGTRVQLGIGVIKEFERFEVRTALHFGLNDRAPDVEGSVWFAWKWQAVGEN